MSGAEGGLVAGKILLHASAEYRESAEVKAGKARVARHARAKAAAADMLTRARNAAGGPDRDMILAAVAEELLDEFSVDEVTIALAGTTVVSRGHTAGRAAHPPVASADLPRVERLGRSASTLSAFGYIPSDRRPALSVGLHSKLRRTFDPAQVALLDTVVDALVGELRKSPSAPAPPRIGRT